MNRNKILAIFSIFILAGALSLTGCAKVDQKTNKSEGADNSTSSNIEFCKKTWSQLLGTPNNPFDENASMPTDQEIEKYYDDLLEFNDTMRQLSSESSNPEISVILQLIGSGVLQMAMDFKSDPGSKRGTPGITAYNQGVQGFIDECKRLGWSY